MNLDIHPAAVHGVEDMVLDDGDDSDFPPVDRTRTCAIIATLATDLVSDDVWQTQHAVSQLKDMVLSTNTHQRFHQDCIGETDGALTGLIFAARNGNATTKYHACLTLAQLAWSHDQNSFRIPEVPGAADVLADIMLNGTNDRAKEYAAVTVGNCGANSSVAAESLVQNGHLMQALATVIRQQQSPRLQETAALALKNCCSNGEMTAFTVARNQELLSTILNLARNEDNLRLQSMGLGAINCLSRSYRAAPILRRSNVVEDVLWPFLAAAVDDGLELMVLTITCAIVNLSVSQEDEHVFVEWVGSKAGRKCVGDLVQCLGRALNDGRWQNVSFSVHSVMYPLHNLLRTCPNTYNILLENDVVLHLDQLFRDAAHTPRDIETLELGVKSLRCLCRDAEAQQRMRKVDLVSSLQTTFELLDPTRGWRLQPEETIVARRIVAEAKEIISELFDAVVTLWMGHHRRLGEASMLNLIDVDCLMMVADFAFYQDRSDSGTNSMIS